MSRRPRHAWQPARTPGCVLNERTEAQGDRGHAAARPRPALADAADDAAPPDAALLVCPERAVGRTGLVLTSAMRQLLHQLSTPDAGTDLARDDVAVLLPFLQDLLLGCACGRARAQRG